MHAYMKRILRIRSPINKSGRTQTEQNERWDQTSKMELNWSYNEESQKGTSRHSFGVEARREKKTGSTKNNMDEEALRWKENSWVAVMGELPEPSQQIVVGGIKENVKPLCALRALWHTGKLIWVPLQILKFLYFFRWSIKPGHWSKTFIVLKHRRCQPLKWSAKKCSHNHTA